MLGDLLVNQASALAPNEESTTNPIYHHVADLGLVLLTEINFPTGTYTSTD